MKVLRDRETDNGLMVREWVSLDVWRSEMQAESPRPKTPATPLPSVAQARLYLRQRIEDVSAGRAAGRFLTNADMAAALVILDHLDSQETLNALLDVVGRAATALESLVSNGARLVVPEHDSP